MTSTDLLILADRVEGLPGEFDSATEAAISEVVNRFPGWQPSPAMLGFARACVGQSLRTIAANQENGL